MKTLTKSVALAVLCGIGTAPVARAQSDSAQIVNVIRTVFVAAQTDDVAKFDSIIAPGFYLYDGGARFNGDSIMGLIKALHAAGKRYEWNVTEPDVHVHGTTAWVAYVNRGSVGDASAMVPQQWLESGVLEKRDGVWKIVFMHSTRVVSSPDHEARRAGAGA
jgi:SnoaL-like domain